LTRSGNTRSFGLDQSFREAILSLQFEEEYRNVSIKHWADSPQHSNSNGKNAFFSSLLNGKPASGLPCPNAGTEAHGMAFIVTAGNNGTT
jgi:hypothetical protein